MWWYGRGNMVAHGCRKRKKLICGSEGEIVVAHGCLPSSAPPPLTPYLGFQLLVVIVVISRNSILTAMRGK